VTDSNFRKKASYAFHFALTAGRSDPSHYLDWAFQPLLDIANADIALRK
jgi:hypothetical protein